MSVPSPSPEPVSAITPFKGVARGCLVVQSIPAGAALAMTAVCVSLAGSFIELLMAALFGIKNGEINNEFAKEFTDALKGMSDRFLGFTGSALYFGRDQFKEAVAELCGCEDFNRRPEMDNILKIVQEIKPKTINEAMEKALRQDVDQGDQFLKDAAAQFGLNEFGHDKGRC
jgi:hypothetical protein